MRGAILICVIFDLSRAKDCANADPFGIAFHTVNAGHDAGKGDLRRGRLQPMMIGMAHLLRQRGALDQG